ncbi:MAG: DUF3109 family protein [Prevotella sp.]|nr:DUF3109 family protein [Prevotella sp.]
MVKALPPILQIGDILISSDLLTEEFCCDLDACHGACCIEGEAGAPVTLDEIMEIENCLDDVWPDLSASAQSVIDRQGVAYTDQEGDLVTSIVGGKDCVFTCYGDIDLGKGHVVNNCCLCALERAATSQSSIHNSQLERAATSHLSPLTSHFTKPISCALYPIREKTFSDGTTALNYHQWDICRSGRELGRRLHLPVYRFLAGPLRRRFGDAWYDELCAVADELRRQGYLPA